VRNGNIQQYLQQPSSETFQVLFLQSKQTQPIRTHNSTLMLVRPLKKRGHFCGQTAIFGCLPANPLFQSQISSLAIAQLPMVICPALEKLELCLQNSSSRYMVARFKFQNGSRFSCSRLECRPDRTALK